MWYFTNQMTEVLDTILETSPVVERLAAKEEEGYQDQEENKQEVQESQQEERKMLETVVMRLQATLLALVKLSSVAGAGKGRGKGKDRRVGAGGGGGGAARQLYSAALQCNTKTEKLARVVLDLITKLGDGRGSL